MIMSMSEALDKARARLGREAVVWRVEQDDPKGIGPLRIGIGETAMRSCVGHGWTWTQAVASIRPTTFMP